jgi:hypothetical protein
MEHVSGLRPIGQDIIVRGADILTVRGFTKVPNFLLETNSVSPGAKLTYAMLLKYAFEKDYCFPGQDRLAKDMGVTRQSTNAYIQELHKAKYIDIKRKGQGRPNTYLLNLSGNGKVRVTR